MKEKVKTGTIKQEGEMKTMKRILMTTTISTKMSTMMIDMEEEEGAGVEGMTALTNREEGEISRKEDGMRKIKVLTN